MSADSSGTVYRLHSTVEIPLDEVHDYFDGADLPEGIADVEITRRNNTLIIDAVPTDDSLSKYTPTAQLKATVTEKRIPEDPPEPQGTGSLQWRPREQDDEAEIEFKIVEYAGFKGTRETVLLNTELQYPMFLVLCELARLAERGTLTAITAADGGLAATRIVDGEDRPASIEVVEDHDEEDEDGINWRDNDFIQ